MRCRTGGGSFTRTVLITASIIIIHLITLSGCQNLRTIFKDCNRQTDTFDNCMKNAFNELRRYFKSGIPEYGIAPFDPHRQQFVELRRGDRTAIGGFHLRLTNVSEYGWTNSRVTSFKADGKHDEFVYSQSFPEKSLDGMYSFKGTILGTMIKTAGVWNMTLSDYTQTTTVSRVAGLGSLLKVRIEIDKLGGLKLKISNFFGGRTVLEKIADFFINTMWQVGFPLIKPLINDLISTAFTDIFNESFRYFPVHTIFSDVPEV